MRKLKLFFACMLLTLLSIGQVWAETATITFANQTSGTGDGSAAYTTSNFVTSGITSSDAAFGTITCSATSKCYSGKVGMGLKAGASSSAGSFTISFSTPITNVSQITLNRAAYSSSKSANITVKDGSTTLANQVTTGTNTSLNDMDITNLNITSLSGLTVETSKYCYIKSITITYTPSSDPAQPTCTNPTTALSVSATSTSITTEGTSTLSIGENTGNGSTVTYSVTSSNATNATINGTTFSATVAGTYTVQASQEDDNGVCGGTATVDITVTNPMRTVNYSINGTASSTQAEEGSNLLTALPANPTSCDEDNYPSFYGWVTSPISGRTTDAPSVVTSGTVSSSTASTTYYAVFTDAASANYSTTYTSNVTLPTSGTNVSSASVVIAETNYDAVKLGKSGSGASCEITIPAGTTKLYLHAAGWNGKSSTLTLSTNVGNISPNDSQNLTSNSGVANNSPFTLNNLSNDYFEYTLTGVTAEAIITITVGSERAVIWGVNATSGSSSGSAHYLTTCCTPLSSISGSVSGQTQNSLDLKWAQLSDQVSAWTVTYREKGSEAEYAAVTTSATTTETIEDVVYNKYTISNLSAGKTYEFKLTATLKSGVCTDQNDFIVEGSTQAAHTITATPNDANLVSSAIIVEGSTITVSPITGYCVAADAAGYTITAGETNITDITNNNNNTLTVNGLNGDVSVTINIVKKDYSVTMAKSAEAASDASVTISADQTKQIDDEVTVSVTAYEGYLFNGWSANPEVTFADATAESTSFTMPASDVTVTANFIKILTVAEARAIIDGNDASAKSNRYATGIVSQIVTAYNSQYGNITYNISTDGKTTSDQLQAYRGKSYNGEDFTSADDIQVGDIVVVFGNLTKYSSTYEFAEGNSLVSLNRPVVTDPIVSLQQSGSIIEVLNVASVNVSEQSIDIVCENFTGENLSVSTQLYSESTCATEITSGAWVTSITVNNENNGLTFNVEDNTGAARETWLKVTVNDGTNEASAVLDIKQAKAVGVATLPFSFDGGKADIENTDGMSADGLGSDYSSSPKLKFDGTGDYLVINIGNVPGEFTYDIKGNNYSGSTFKVQQSADGVNYSDVATYTELSDKQEESKNLAQTTRYVRFIYTEKVSGNVALGNIAIAEYVEPTVCEAPAFAPEDGESFAETLDVVLTSTTEGATIYYTLDDSEPTTNSNIFDEKITISETTTIKAIAVKEGLNNSSVSSATFTKVLIINSYEIDFETNDLAPYVKWEFNNIACATSTIAAHGGTYYGNTEGKASASITTREKVATPGVLTFWTSKESGNTTASYWTVEVSENGTDWTQVGDQFSATTGSKGTWTKREADLSEHTNVYVRISYGSNQAIRAIDDISLEMASAVKKPTISGTTPFVTSTTVTLECETTGATIYYTTDGTDPKSGSVYSGALNITETTTVKAIAKVGEEWSTANEKTFSQVDIWTVARANTELASSSTLNGKYVHGIISQIDSYGSNSITYWISDDGSTTGQLEVYKGKNLNNTDFSIITDLTVGDIVVVYGDLTVFKGTNEFSQGNYLVSKEAPAVAAPVFTPDGGGFVVSTDVTIACTTTGSTIYYTLDGTAPTNESTQYTEAIALTDDATIKAIAYAGENHSIVITKSFTKTAPKTVAEAYDELTEDPINNVAVEGIVYQVDRCTEGGTAQYWISDEEDPAAVTDNTKVLEIYNGNGLNNQPFAANGIRVGDKVIVFGNLKIYNNSTKEFDSGSRLLSLERKTVSSVVVSGTPEKTSYKLGDEFDPNGLTVTITYNDQSTTTVAVTECTWEKTPATFTEAGTGKSVSVKATYEEIQSVAYLVEDLTVLASHNVVYNTTGSQGTTPVDENTYEAGATVTLLSAAGLTNAGYIFNGWNATYVDGNNDTQTLEIEDNQFTMPDFDVTVTATWARKLNDKWVKVTSTVDLVDDDEYIIVNTDATYALGEQRSNNRGTVEIDVTPEGVVKISSAVTVFTLGVISGNEGNKYTFKDGSAYLCAVSSGSNNMKTQTTLDDNGKWTINIVDGLATITATGTFTRNRMRYNPNNGSPLFSCYATNSTTGTLVTIYKKAPKVQVEENQTTDIEDVSANSDIEVKAGGTLNIDAAKTVGDLTVESGAKVVLDGVNNYKLTITGTFTFSATMAGGLASSDFTGANASNIELGDDAEVFFDITLGENGRADQWHAFTVPFPVDALNGVYDLDGNQLINETNYAIMSYHGDIRANGGYGWQKDRGILVPGTFYLMTVDGGRTTYRFKKASGALVAQNSKTLTAYSGTGAGSDQGWNGVGNPNLFFGTVAYIAYVLDPTSYTFKDYDPGEMNFAVGTPFFIQTTTPGTMSMDDVDENYEYYSPARTQTNAIENIKVFFGNDEYKDRLTVSASEDALNEYQIGKDLVEMKMTNAPRVAQITANAYNSKLTRVYAPLANNQAIYDLDLYAPAAGTYSISAQQVEGATLYVTYNDAIVWNLSLGDYELDLTRGTTTGYGLLLVAQPNQMPTGLDTTEGVAGDAVQKILLNGQLYILRDGHLFDAVGHEMK